MNAPLTRAADGLMRRAFTVKDVLRMVEMGILGHDERFELIGGEIVPMSPKGIRHETIKTWLNLRLARNLPEGLWMSPETTFYLSDDTFVEPDFVIYPAHELDKLSPETCLLAIEVADSSLDYDMGRKARLYAEFGIRELWVINARNEETRVHRLPANGRYTELADVHAGVPLVPQDIPGLGVTLGSIG